MKSTENYIVDIFPIIQICPGWILDQDQYYVLPLFLFVYNVIKANTYTRSIDRIYIMIGFCKIGGKFSF